MDHNLELGSLSGVHLNVVSVDAQPFMAQAEYRFGHGVITGGLFGTVFQILADQLHFSYNLTILYGYRYGAFRNGSWDGMIGLLSRNEVDMTVSELSMTEDRLDLIGYSMALDSVGRKIYIRRMLQEVPLDWNFYIAPFSVNLHFMVLFWLWSMSLILWVLQRYPTGQFPYTFMHRRITMKEYVWIAFSCLCQKGAHLLPHIRSSKIVFLVFAFTFLIVYCAYSATLISQLSIAPPVTIPFKGLQDFVTKAKGWTGGPIKGDLMQLYMEKSCPVLLKKGPNAQCELLVQLWTKVVEAEKNRLPTSFIEGLDRVLKEKFAFIASGPGTRNIITKHFPKKDACNIFEMDGDYISSNLAFGFRRNFSHTRSINKQILIIRSSGIYNRLQRIWLPQFEQCAESTTSYTDAGIKNVGVAPLVWLIGGLLSLVILIFEMLNSLTVNRSTLEMNSVYNKKY